MMQSVAVDVSCAACNCTVPAVEEFTTIPESRQVEPCGLPLANTIFDAVQSETRIARTEELPKLIVFPVTVAPDGTVNSIFIPGVLGMRHCASTSKYHTSDAPIGKLSPVTSEKVVFAFFVKSEVV